MDLIPHGLEVSVVLQNATKYEWVWNLPLHSPVVIFFHPLCIHCSTAAVDTNCKPYFLCGNRDPMKNNFCKSQTYFAIKLNINESMSYLLSYLQDSLAFKDALRVSICGTASNSAVTKSIPYSVNPQLKQTSLIFWGYPKIFLFRKQVNQVQLRLVSIALAFFFIPPHPLTEYYWAFMTY